MADTVKSLREANQKLQQKYATANLNYEKFRAQWEDARKKLDAMRDNFYPTLRKYGLLRELEWGLWEGDMVDRLCKLLVETRGKNKKAQRQLRLYRASSSEEVKAVVDEAVREIRQERYRWFPPPDPDLMDVLWEKVKRLRREVRTFNEISGLRNVELDALHYVWCNGGCEGGVHRYDREGTAAITEEIVQTAERNTSRLRAWFNNHEAKRAREESK